MSRSAQSGVSLIELMVAVAIVAIVIGLGLPSFTTWIQNTQIRTASEAILNGLQTARNESIRRNTPMQLKLNGGTTTQWAVNFFTDPDRDPPMYFRAAAEGSPNAVIAVTPGGADTVTFSALGRVITNADGSPSMTRIDIDNPTIAVPADRRSLSILIPLGGAIRLCDPKVLGTDPRTCNP
jgi:type IV fimbrial biogenesis protein FimT